MKPIRGRKPPTLGMLADQAYQLRVQRLDLQKKVEALQAQEALFAQGCLDALSTAGLQRASGKLATISTQHTSVYKVADWDQVLAYIRKGNWDLLHKRVSTEAARARFEAHKEIPGLDVVPLVRLSITKAGTEK